MEVKCSASMDTKASCDDTPSGNLPKTKEIKKKMDLKPHTCPHPGCISAFDRPFKLQQHVLLHNNVRPHKCPEAGCDREYSSRSHLNRHIKASHSNETQTTEHFGCPICFKPFANKQNLKRHIKLFHLEADRFTCPHCSESFKKKHLLTSHMFFHTGVKAFKCDMCELTFISNYEKKRHMRIHSIYTCEDCFKEFNLWSKYQDHRKTEHVHKEFICDHCDRKFAKRVHIVRHMRFHYLNQVIPSLFCCPFLECTKIYNRRNNLKAHLKSRHYGITLSCTICSAKLTTKATLQKHMANHNRPTDYTKKPPKTKETGRKPRKDKGVAKTTTAMKILGIPKEALEWMAQEDPLNCCIKAEESLYSTTKVEEMKSEIAST